MIPFENLTYRGQVSRFRLLAKKALEEYSVRPVRLRFLKHAENTTFRVFTSPKDTPDEGFFVPGNFLLRVHRSNYQTKNSILSELMWLADINKTTSIKVPEPLTTKTGQLITEIQIKGIPEARTCSLLRWLPGRFCHQEPTPKQAYSLGKTMAGLHNHVSGWQRPCSFERRHLDYDGLFGENAGFELPSQEIWGLLPRECVKLFERVASRTSKLIERWKQSTFAYGLLHADLHLGNVLFHQGIALPLDFDDCGYGPWVFDFAVPLADWLSLNTFSLLKRNLLAGYEENRELPKKQLEHLPIFIAARRVGLALWFVDRALVNPRMNELKDVWLPKLFDEIESLVH